MFDALETGIGLEIVLWFQAMRFGLGDAVATAFHYANDGIFYIVVFGVIYWLFDKRLGMRMFFALLTISLIVTVAKELFGRPRPFLVSLEVMPLVDEIGNGIPSGHASMPLVIWGYFALWMRRRWITLVVAVYVFLQGISRLYLGVHFPQDVIVGWILGSGVLAAYWYASKPVARWWQGQAMPIQIAPPLVVALLAMLAFFNDENVLTTAGLLIGTGIAVVLETRYVQFTPPPTPPLKIAHYVAGLLACVLVLEGLGMLFDQVAPPSYSYAERNQDGALLLAQSLSLTTDDPTALCTAADNADLEAFVNVCVVDVTPLAGVLRVVRYGLVALLALGLVPALSVRANVMRSQAPQTATTTAGM